MHPFQLTRLRTDVSLPKLYGPGRVDRSAPHPKVRTGTFECASPKQRLIQLKVSSHTIVLASLPPQEKVSESLGTMKDMKGGERSNRPKRGGGFSDACPSWSQTTRQSAPSNPAAKSHVCKGRPPWCLLFAAAFKRAASGRHGTPRRAFPTSNSHSFIDPLSRRMGIRMNRFGERTPIWSLLANDKGPKRGPYGKTDFQRACVVTSKELVQGLSYH